MTRAVRYGASVGMSIAFTMNASPLSSVGTSTVGPAVTVPPATRLLLQAVAVEN